MQWFSAKKAKTPPPPVEEDEEEDDGALKKKDRLLILAIWVRLNENADRFLIHLAEALRNGPDNKGIDLDTWAESFRHEFRGVFAQAWEVGRMLAGDTAASGRQDADAGEAEWERQEEFFAGFIVDLKAGKYEIYTPTEEEQAEAGGASDSPPKSDKQFMARNRAYLAAAKGSATEAFRQEMGSALLDWVLGPAEHCSPSPNYPYNCPDLAESGPKPADQWETAPGRMETPCGNNCACELRAVDGSYSTEGL